MSQLDLARIQFASTSLHHSLVVPMTMGLALLVAFLHRRPACADDGADLWHRDRLLAPGSSRLAAAPRCGDG